MQEISRSARNDTWGRYQCPGCGHVYDEQLAGLDGGMTAWEVFESVATTDVRRACDLFRPVYDRTNGEDGYVSLEVSPNVADDADGTVAEARRLWGVVDRPNVMIKVPGTDAGVRAVRQLIEDGINVNVTLLFAVDAHRRVIEAYLGGLEARAAAGKPVDHIASVASFFVSRVDTAIDKRLGYPTHDPHGDPIPNAELEVETTELRTLCELTEGESATVLRVPDGDSGLLRYLTSLSLVPGSRVELRHAAPFGGPVTVAGDAGEHAISRELATLIGVG